jgi:hypothetical protein
MNENKQHERDENPDMEDPAASATACVKIRAYHTYIRTTYKLRGIFIYIDVGAY